jgi:hypothetical protein
VLLPVAHVQRGPFGENRAALVTGHGAPDGERCLGGEDGLFDMLCRCFVDGDGVLRGAEGYAR